MYHSLTVHFQTSGIFLIIYRYIFCDGNTLPLRRSSFCLASGRSLRTLRMVGSDKIFY